VKTLPIPLIRMAAAPAATRPAAATSTEGPRFEEILRGALDKTQALHEVADARVEQFLQGEDIPVHEVMAALAEADLSTKLATAVTTKVIEAYKALTQMQV